MKLSPLTIGFGVSLLVHGMVFSTLCAIKLGDAPNGSPSAPASSPILELEIVSEAAPEQALPNPVPSAKSATVVISVHKDFEMKSEATPIASVIHAPLPEAPKMSIAAAGTFSTDEDGGLDSAEPELATFSTVANKTTSIADRNKTSSETGIEISHHADYLFNPKPAYPEEARRHQQQGVVILAVMVTEKGGPASVGVVQSSGYKLLDEAAVSAVRRWQFVPARSGSATMASEVKIPIQFKLSN